MTRHILMIVLATLALVTPRRVVSEEEVTEPGQWVTPFLIETKPSPDPGPQTIIYDGSTIESRLMLTMDSPDITITPLSNTAQSENSVFVDPMNPLRLINSNNSELWPLPSPRVIYGADYWVSNDGGQTWTGSVQGAGGPNGGDPATAINSDGRMFVNFINTANGGQSIAYSDNDGASWSTIQIAAGIQYPYYILDKNHMWVDNGPASPHNGNLYVAWTNFLGATPRQVELSRSINGGLSWSTPVNLSSAIQAGTANHGVNIQTGANGEVYVAWSVYDSGYVSEDAIGFTRSTDGGVTWSPARRIITGIRGHRGIPLGGGKTMRHNSFPSVSVNQQTGEIFVVWTNIGIPGINTGDPDVYMIRSADGGDSWGSPQRVNQDTVGNGKDQWFPWISCDPSTGLLACIFYDSREFPGNDMAETWVALSLDNGDTWEDFRVSDVAWSGDAYVGDYAGDYIAIASRDNQVYPIWSDNRSGNMLAYISPFTVSTVVEYPGDGRYETLQAAIDDVVPGTTIEVDGSQVTELHPEPAIRMKRGVLVQAKPGEPAPVINAQGAASGVVFPSDSDARTEISGFLVENFSTNGIAVETDPIDGATTATITACTILGGNVGVYAEETNLVVRDCVIRDQGGVFPPVGIYVEDYWFTTPSGVTSEISGNVIVSSSTEGRGIHISAPGRLFTITGNTVDGWGKGVDLYDLPNGETTVVMRNIAVNGSEAGFSRQYDTVDLQHNVAWGNGDNSVRDNFEGFSNPLAGGLNLMVDPLLCEKPNQSVEPWALRIDSPAMDPVVGQIGARGIECAWGDLVASTTVPATSVTVLEDLTVPAGLSLTLLPGATFSFDAADESGGGSYIGTNELIVAGSLQAGDPAGAPVIFTSASAAPSPSDWAMIEILGAATVQMENAVVEYADIGVHYTADDPLNRFEGVTFRNNGLDDVRVDAHIDGPDGPAGTFENCTFEAAATGGVAYAVRVHWDAEDLVFQECTFQGTSLQLAGLCFDFSGSQVSGGTIGGYSMGSGIEARNSVSPSVQNVTLESNKYGLQWRDSAGGLIEGCTFNKGASQPTDIWLRNSASPTISTCSFSVNAGNTGILCGDQTAPTIGPDNDIQARKYGVSADWASSPRIRESTITGCYVAVKSSSTADPDVGTVADPGNNNITASTFRHVDGGKARLFPLVAEKNWWGQSPPDPTKFTANVDYDPWLAAPPLGSASWELAEVKAITIDGAFPNPMQESTRLRFQAPEGGNGQVEVFDVAGRLVHSFELGSVGPGQVEVPWDGRDQSGNRVAPGVYLYRFRVGRQTTSGRLTVIR